MTAISQWPGRGDNDRPWPFGQDAGASPADGVALKSKDKAMVAKALFVRLEAQPGKMAHLQGQVAALPTIEHAEVPATKG